jgi:transposase
MARPRKYPPELLDRGARVVLDSGRPIAHVARDLGVPSETLRRYVRQVEADEGLRPGLPTTEEREEIKALRREV